MKASDLSVTQYIAVGLFVAIVGGVAVLWIENREDDAQPTQAARDGSPSSLSESLGVDCEPKDRDFVHPALRDQYESQDAFDCELSKMLDGLDDQLQ